MGDKQNETSLRSYSFLSHIRKSKITLFSLVGITLFYIAQYKYKWPFLRYSLLSAGSNNADFRWIVDSANCSTVTDTPVESGDPCSNYLYGRVLLKIIQIGHISSNNAQTIGYMIAFLGLISLMHLIVPRYLKDQLSLREYLLCLFILILWPTQLIIQRANIDIVIFILLLVASRYGEKRPVSSSILIALTAVCKFYTLPLLILFFVFYSKKGNRIVMGLILLISGSICIRDMLKVRVSINQNGSGQFGLQGIYLDLLNIGFEENVSLAASILIVLVTIVLLLRHKSKVDEYNKIQSTTFIFGVTFLSCYFAGMNYDYRLLFALPAVIAILSESTRRNADGSKLFCILVFSFIFTCEIGNTHNLFRFDSYAFLLKSLYLFSDIAVMIFALYLLTRFAPKKKLRINKEETNNS